MTSAILISMRMLVAPGGVVEPKIKDSQSGPFEAILEGALCVAVGYRPVPPIFLVSGPPAAGKTTLCAALLERFERGFHLPVDDLRTWVVRGLSESVPWTDETERQFQIAEAAARATARIYRDAGFAVAVDHCRNPRRLDEAFAGLNPVKVLLMPDLATNLLRSHSRTNKAFDPHLLDETIEFTNGRYGLDVGEDWLTIDNARLTVEETVERIIGASRAVLRS